VYTLKRNGQPWFMQWLNREQCSTRHRFYGPTSASTSRKPAKALNRVFICLPFLMMLFVRMSLIQK
jgi:hypothetical protein